MTTPATDVRFRTAPGLSLSAWTDEQLAAARDGSDAPPGFGVAVVPGQQPVAVGRDAALLLFALHDPGPLPAALSADLLAEDGRRLLELVALRLLEVQVEAGDGFVSGPEALARLAGPTDRGTAQVELSARILGLVARTEPTDPVAVTHRLYTANAWPATRELRRTAAAGDGTDALNLPAIDTSLWDHRLVDGWVQVRGRDARGEASLGATWKLYVSPRPAVLPDVMGPLAQGLHDGGVRHWKIGRGVAGLVRPDRIVAYTPDKVSLHQAVAVVAAALSGVAAHGVPFAASAGADTLLSWGVDPVGDGAGAGRGSSWRLHACQSLAAGLVDGWQQGLAGDELADHARRLATLDGLDPATLGPRTWWLDQVGAS